MKLFTLEGTHMMTKSAFKVLALLPILFLFACANDVGDARLNSNKVRVQSIRESALSFGAQSGLAWQSSKINAILAKYSKSFKQIYNFNAMVMAHNIMPPIVRESVNGLNVDDPNTLRLSDRTIEIVRPARFVTTPPSWQDYLTMHYKKPERPPKTLLPANAEERQIWDHYIAAGWQNGYDQANAILQQNLGKITQDLTGMALYHALYAQNMVSAPFVAAAPLGITGNKKRMVIGNKILKITAHADLLPKESHRWHPALRVTHKHHVVKHAK